VNDYYIVNFAVPV